MKVKPVRVYLDNSDFSRLYRPSTPALEALKTRLLQLADDGIAAFYMSYWHIFEFLQPATAGYLEDRRLRARFMKRLCGRNTLPYITDVINGTEHGVHGVWLPSTVLTSQTSSFKEKLKAVIAEKAPNRAARRIASSPQVQKRVIAQKFVGNIHERRVQDIEGLTDEFVAAAPTSMYAKGELSERQYHEALAKMFCDPTYFFEKWFVEQRRQNPMRLQVVNAGSAWINNMQSMAKQYSQYRQARSKIARARRDLHRSLRESHLPSDLKTIVYDKIPDLPPAISIDDSRFSIPNVSPRLRYIECYLKHHFSAQASKVNDLGDLMHLFYTPNVDIMRCDRAIHDAVKRCPHLEVEKLLPALELVEPMILRLSAE